MPNNYTNVILCYPRTIDDYGGPSFVDVLKEWANDVLERLLPCPHKTEEWNGMDIMPDARYRWCRDNWGTKWDVYDVDACELGGDQAPHLLQFQTAWSPPNEEARRVLLADLATIAEGIVWVGMNPYDCSSRTLGGDS